MTEEQQVALEDIKERLYKVEILIPDERYAVLVQSLRDDVRTLLDLVEEQERNKDELVFEALTNAPVEKKVYLYNAFVQAFNPTAE